MAILDSTVLEDSQCPLVEWGVSRLERGEHTGRSEKATGWDAGWEHLWQGSHKLTFTGHAELQILPGLVAQTEDKRTKKAFIGLRSLETAIKKLPDISPALVFVMCAHMHVWAHMCAPSRRNLELLRWPGTCGNARPWGGEVAEGVSGNYIKWGNSVRRIYLHALISNVSCKVRLGQSLTELRQEGSSHQMQIYKGKRIIIPVFSTKTSRPLEF